MASLLLILGVLFILSSTILIAVDKKRRDTVLGRVLPRQRSNMNFGTPPRSLSPEKQRIRDDAAPDYSSTFPPSRRFALASGGVALHSDWTNRMLPIDASYLEAPTDRYTPCGFSVAEIKDTGDFPDYAALSGVPLPKAYPDFNIKHALPRPYRPLRWAYHQTMCMTPFSVKSSY